MPSKSKKRKKIKIVFQKSLALDICFLFRTKEKWRSRNALINVITNLNEKHRHFIFLLLIYLINLIKNYPNPIRVIFWSTLIELIKSSTFQDRKQDNFFSTKEEGNLICNNFMETRKRILSLKSTSFTENNLTSFPRIWHIISWARPPFFSFPWYLTLLWSLDGFLVSHDLPRCPCRGLGIFCNSKIRL